MAMQCAHEWCTSLQQRQTSCDQLLCFEAVDMPTSGGDGDREKAERVAHGREAYSSKRVIAPLRRFAISARCWLDSDTCVIDAVCCCTTALTSWDVAAFCSATAAITSISRARASASSRWASLASTISAMASRLLSISTEMRVSDAA